MTEGLTIARPISLKEWFGSLLTVLLYLPLLLIFGSLLIVAFTGEGFLMFLSVANEHIIFSGYNFSVGGQTFSERLTCRQMFPTDKFFFLSSVGKLHFRDFLFVLTSTDEVPDALANQDPTDICTEIFFEETGISSEIELLELAFPEVFQLEDDVDFQEQAKIILAWLVVGYICTYIYVISSLRAVYLLKRSKLSLRVYVLILPVLTVIGIVPSVSLALISQAFIARDKITNIYFPKESSPVSLFAGFIELTLLKTNVGKKYVLPILGIQASVSAFNLLGIWILGLITTYKTCGASSLPEIPESESEILPIREISDKK